MYHYNDTRSRDLVSRVCTVAQYAVSEANAKSMGEAHFRTPHPSETPQRSTSYQIYYYVPPRELMCKIWLESIQPLRIRHAFVWNIFIKISISLSINVKKLNSLHMVLEAKAHV